MLAAGCFNLQERLLPYLRAETARRLSEHGLRQQRIAEHLGVSQAMVSKYLRTSVAAPTGAPAATLQTLVDRAAETVLEEEGKGRLPAWCPLCPQLWGRPITAAAPGADLQECLRGERPPAHDESLHVLQNVTAAGDRLRRLGFGRLAPQVNVNVAMALPDAHDPRGVAAFPGRLVEVAGEVRPVSEPGFGASNHLSQILLRVGKTHPAMRAVMCLRDGDDVRRALRAAGLRFRILRRSRRELVVSLPRQESHDALIDPGDFGIEPITYLLGETALDVVDKGERLLRSLPRSSPGE